MNETVPFSTLLIIFLVSMILVAAGRETGDRRFTSTGLILAIIVIVGICTKAIGLNLIP